MDTLNQQQQTILQELVSELESIEGISAIVLGGSHARGRAHADSDLDIGLYYRDVAPFAIEDIRTVVRQISNQADPQVFSFGEWGPWANGGVWLTIEQQRVDLIYRSLDQVESVLSDAHQGRYEIHYTQQPPFGFFSPTYLGEVAVAMVLRDPQQEIEVLQLKVADYPDALRNSVIQNCLWGVEFGLNAFAPKFAQQGDVYGVAGCLTRFAFYLVLTLFALNRVYLLNDKTALAEVVEFATTPEQFSSRIQALLADIGDTPERLFGALKQMRDIFEQTTELTGGLYVSRQSP